MGLRVNQNIAAQTSYRGLSLADKQMSRSLEKLSSGFRINRAADDAAGLAISEGLRSQVGGLKTAGRNAQDGISVLQTAEGALTEVHSILQRMRVLAVQAANDSNSGDARANLTAEVESLTEELVRIGASTTFNGKQLLNGAGTMSFQVGAGSDAHSRIDVNLDNADVTAVAAGLSTISRAFDIGPVADLGNPLVALFFGPGYTVSPHDVRVSTAGGTYNTMQDVANHLNNDAGFETKYTASVDQNDHLVVSSLFGSSEDLTWGIEWPGAVTVSPSGPTQVKDLSLNSHVDARAAINVIEAQIDKVSAARAELGAYQNRFEHTINNINVSIENLSTSESRIRDTDMAQEMTSFTRSQILSQASTTILSQANQSQQGVLTLLR